MEGRKFTTSKLIQLYNLEMHEYKGSLESLRLKDSNKCSPRRMCFRVVELFGSCFSQLIFDSCMFYYWCRGPPEPKTRIKHSTPAASCTPMRIKDSDKSSRDTSRSGQIDSCNLKYWCHSTLELKTQIKSTLNKSCTSQTSGQLGLEIVHQSTSG